ncbi:RNA polymerase sigma factor [Shinella pollutisoli]|uniref:RNA polymerase sigma factor n=1 Tax=Shinella pollutisoli TaxID=2250594 RepID=A0ABV7DNW5_9HYPH|nr:RNA polymerase sigma factor [Shinella pollutisoli]
MSSRSEEIEALYNSERLRLERMVVGKVGASNAADVVQDVFAAVWSRAKEHVKLSPSYLSQAAKFTAISRFRSERRRVVFFAGITEEQYSAPVAMPDQIVSAREDLKRLEETVIALPTRTRQIFLLNRMHGCTYEEIAAGLDISYSTVEREMAKAIMACKGAR